ncbi:MAG: hypothetical protein ACLQDY_02745 [Streptosporangiaceae bacterium]
MTASEVIEVTTPRMCAIGGCEEPVRRRGMCGAHYGRWLRQRDDMQPIRPGDQAGQGKRYPGLSAAEMAGRADRPVEEVRRNLECAVSAGWMVKTGADTYRLAGSEDRRQGGDAA